MFVGVLNRMIASGTFGSAKRFALKGWVIRAMFEIQFAVRCLVGAIAFLSLVFR